MTNQQQFRDPTSSLAAFAANLRFENVPAAAVDRAKQCLMDSIGVMIGALQLDEGKAIVSFAKVLAAGGNEDTTVLGAGKLPPIQAIFANGCLSETLEMQDGRPQTGLHPCSSVIPAALAAGETKGISGRDLLTALLAGYEVVSRIGAATHARSFGRIMTTGTFGAFGAAAAAGNAWKLPAEVILNAFGVAGFLTPLCIGENFWAGVSCKTFKGGQGAEVGMKSLLAAIHGFAGSPNILVGSPPRYVGVCSVLVPEAALHLIDEKLGEEFAIVQVYFKPYPSGRINHGAIDCVQALLAQHQLKAGNIKRVTVRANSNTAWTVGQVRTTVESPLGQCLLSLPYAVAVTLIDGEYTLRQILPARRADPAVHALANRVVVEASADFDAMGPATRPTAVEIETAGEQVVSSRVDYPKGDYRNPMSWSEVEAKYRQLTGPVLAATQISESIAMIRSIESLDNVRKLTALLRPR